MAAATILLLVAAAACWVVVRECVHELARRAAVQTPNHRGLPIAATGGIALMVGLALAAAIVVIGRTWVDLDPTAVAVLVGAVGLVPVAAAFGLLGLYDDIAGSPYERDWSAHVRAVRQRRATPGAIKVVGGAAIALIAAPGGSLLDVVGAAVVIALGAHLVSALDGIPLRAIKGAIIWMLALLVWAVVVPVAVPVGAVVIIAAGLAALWLPERQERIMLGDAGSNAIGAALGWLTVVTEVSGRSPVGPGTGRWVVLGTILALTALSIRPGFETIIRKVPPLAALDRMSRQPDPLRGEPSN